LELSSEHHERRRDAWGLEQFAAKILGMQLLIFPDPDQGLSNQIASFVTDIEGGNPGRHSLFPVGHRHDLFALEGKQHQAVVFQQRAPLIFGVPLVERLLHIIQKGALKLICRR
jgi:hypothetical protein